MSGTQRKPALARYRDAVAEQMRAGEPFGQVEDSLDEDAELRDPAEQQLDARAHLASLQ